MPCWRPQARARRADLVIDLQLSLALAKAARAEAEKGFNNFPGKHRCLIDRAVGFRSP